ncbi:MAG: hypothetical protein ACKOBN_07015 [Flavobacteriales bacterium]
MKKLSLLVLLTFGFLGSTTAQTKKYHGVSFYTDLKLDGESLLINGAVLRLKFWF